MVKKKQKKQDYYVVRDFWDTLYIVVKLSN